MPRQPCETPTLELRDPMTDRPPVAGPRLPTLDRLRTWREASTSGDAIATALASARAADRDTGRPWARLPLLVYPAQALALTLALVRGSDPAVPRHLGQVVILDQE
jgi:hypothetical protein